MKLTFLGAAREVTGSRFFLEACGKNWMIDYGMEQGADIYENAPLPVAASQIAGVFLTHAHIDHSGYLPLLYKQGFRGPVYATEATSDLCGIMLLDSAHIQEMEAEWKNRKAQRSGRALEEPLYTQRDALETHALFRPCKYRESVPVTDGLAVRFIDVGHLLGSASVELTVTENGETRRVVFSGDIGNLNQPLLRDPEYLERADYVVMESTYGNRSHGAVPDYVGAFVEVLQRTFDRGGNVVIPSFAVGRTQEVLYFLRMIKQEKRVRGHEGFSVYMDSPLATKATEIFSENHGECADEDTLALIRQGINPLSFDGLKLAVSAEESKRINEDSAPKVIISASGMCDAGRIRHHLKHNLWRPECTVLFVGYQSAGTLGRSLTDGARSVKIFGETIEVRADIEKLAGISGHADRDGLLKWIAAIQTDLKRVFVVHGEDSVAEAFAEHLRETFPCEACAPFNGESWDLTRNRLLEEGNRVRLEKADREAVSEREESASRAPTERKPRRAPEPGASAAYAQLTAALGRLQTLAERFQGASRKDLQKLTNQINMLCGKFDRRRH